VHGIRLPVRQVLSNHASRPVRTVLHGAVKRWQRRRYAPEQRRLNRAAAGHAGGSGVCRRRMNAGSGRTGPNCRSRNHAWCRTQNQGGNAARPSGSLNHAQNPATLVRPNGRRARRCVHVRAAVATSVGSVKWQVSGEKVARPKTCRVWCSGEETSHEVEKAGRGRVENVQASFQNLHTFETQKCTAYNNSHRPRVRTVKK